MSFEKGIFIFSIDSDIKADAQMYQEFFDTMKDIYVRLGRAYPIMVKVPGFVSMDNESRRIAKKNRDNGFIYASATVTPSMAIAAMIQLIIKIVGSKNLPKAFFYRRLQAEEWLEKKRIELGHDVIRAEEVKRVFPE